MSTKWGGEAEWEARRDAFLDKAPKAPKLLQYSAFVGPFDTWDEDQRRQYAVDSMLVAAKFGDTDNKLGRTQAYKESIFPMDFKEPDNQQFAVNACPGSSSCGTFIRGTWQLLGAGDSRIFNDKTKVDRQLRGSYDNNFVMQQIAAWAYDCGALHGKYSAPGGKPIEGPAIGLDDPTLWKPADVIFIWQQFAEPKDGVTGKHHIFTVTEKPTSVGKGKWEVTSVDGGSASLGSDKPCMGISINTRTVTNLTGKLVVHVGKTFGDGDVSYWIDFAKVRFTDKTFFLREPGENYPGANDPWP
jgi:hypothetical protein